MISFDRRTVLGAFAALGATPTFAQRITDSDQAFARIRASLGRGGRLGVMAIDTGTGRRIGFDTRGRYAMCSVFKLPLAAFVLRLCDQRALDPGEMLKFAPDDPLDNSPVVEANLRRGRLSVEELATAIVQKSDNSAANLLLRRVGGPAAVTRFIRSCGDNVTRVDRYEMVLNSNVAGDPRETTTPLAMAEFARTVLLGRVLTPTAMRKLTDWLVTSLAKPDRLAAGFPKGWKAGHNPGRGAMAQPMTWPSSGRHGGRRSSSLPS